MKVALVYDRVNKWGGAERLLLNLHELFPQAPLYTSVYLARRAVWSKIFPEIVPSFLQKIPFVKKYHEYFPSLMPLAFESFSFDEYELVVSLTSEAAKGIITKPGTLHICFCLTPTRYLWSGYDFYFRNSFLRLISKPVVSYLRSWDRVAAQRPDVLIAISTEVKKRIKKYYARDSYLIYPPVDLGGFNLATVGQKSEFYLIVSRLVPYKRVDLAIEAFNQLELPLVIVGIGKEKGRLKRKAKRNIKFVGQLTDAELSDYYNNCAGLIFPQEEDFGLVAAEAQTLGKSVIAYKAGGALDIVVDGLTGIFFDKQEPESLIRAVGRFQKMKFKSRLISQKAKRFSKERFKREFLRLVKDVKR